MARIDVTGAGSAAGAALADSLCETIPIPKDGDVVVVGEVPDHDVVSLLAELTPAGRCVLVSEDAEAQRIRITDPRVVTAGSVEASWGMVAWPLLRARLGWYASTDALAENERALHYVKAQLHDALQRPGLRDTDQGRPDLMAAMDHLLIDLRLSPGKRILDVGCGAGDLYEELAIAALHDRFRYRGVDLDPSAAQFRFPEASWAVGRFPECLEDSSTEDVIFAMDLLGDVGGIERSLRRLWDSCSGVLYVTVQVWADDNKDAGWVGEPTRRYVPNKNEIRWTLRGLAGGSVTRELYEPGDGDLDTAHLCIVRDSGF